MTSRTYLTTDQCFSIKLLDWFDEHGRHDLPWQKNRNAYRVWVSEIMLQQTQVTTVIPYFSNFMTQFPDIYTLAAALIDDVLALWTGLGYYSRARNLHKCAQQVVTQWQGHFPAQLEALMTMPGIGRSTAAAIISQAFNQPAAILDGNVKRVLARFYAIDGWPGQGQVEKQLWQLAENLTPTQRNADYTQAIMDLGATICKRQRPLCIACPMQDECSALAQHKTEILPSRKPKKEIPTKHTWALLMMNHNHEVLLQQRPSQGIWGRLWSLAEFTSQQTLKDYIAQLGLYNKPHPYKTQANDSNLGNNSVSIETLPVIKHAFSHYKLHIHPTKVQLPENVLTTALDTVKETGNSQWIDYQQSQKIGLPSPIKKLIYQHWTK